MICRGVGLKCSKPYLKNTRGRDMVVQTIASFDGQTVTFEIRYFDDVGIVSDQRKPHPKLSRLTLHQ